MMDSLLDTRRESPFPTSADFFDEDVNVYLASLLTSHVYDGGKATAHLVMPYDVSLFEAAARESEPRRRFELYRANADHILVRMGIFDNPSGRRPCSAPHMSMSREGWLGRGSAYYRLAWASAMETFRRPTAVGDVMEKLSSAFERYVGVLSGMRSSRLGIVPRLSDGSIFHLGRSVLEEDRKKETALLYDRFLDRWNEYRASGDPGARKDLEEITGMLREADPSFDFDPLSG